MTELEKMKHAQRYILDLAKGVDPISKGEMPEDSCLNNVRLSRCFFYVAEVLGKVIANGGQAGGKYQGTEFILTDEFKERLVLSDGGVQITHFVKPINDLAVEKGMQRVPPTAWTDWLVEKGYLEEVIWGNDNKRRKEPTKKGEALGITSEFREGRYGMYKAVLYGEGAQKLMIEHMEEIVGRWKGRKVDERKEEPTD